MRRRELLVLGAVRRLCRVFCCVFGGAGLLLGLLGHFLVLLPRVHVSMAAIKIGTGIGFVCFGGICMCHVCRCWCMSMHRCDGIAYFANFGHGFVCETQY